VAQGRVRRVAAPETGAIAFTLDDEESLTVFGVTQRLTVGFDRDKVTKKFYGEFEKQRKAFADFIEGIPDTGEDLRWYTAVLIDRLMFLWFLQEKLFLDGKKDYLQQHLTAHLEASHDISFYRRFPLPAVFPRLCRGAQRGQPRRDQASLWRRALPQRRPVRPA
jgi:hypothetical protein